MTKTLRVNALGALAAVALFWAAAPDAPVADAAMRGDVQEVKALLEKGADVNAAQGDGMTALHWAAENGNAELVKTLLYAGANVEAATRDGAYTALHLAARAGHAGAIEALVAGGADVGARTTTRGATPLHFAVGSGHLDAVKALLDHGAEVDAREKAYDQTPLMWAADFGYTDIVKLLVAHGADVSLTSRAEDVAARAEREAKELRERNARMDALRGIQTTRDYPLGQPPADQKPADAAKPGAKTAAAKPGAEKPGAKDAAEKPAAEKPEAQKPAAEKSGGVIRTIDQLKAEEKPKDAPEAKKEEAKPLSYDDLIGRKGGLTPLEFAVRQGNRETVMALLDAGADINQVSDGDHSSPLLLATINGQWDLAEELMARGADPNLASDAGATPLYAAINLQWHPKSIYPQPQAYLQQKTTYLQLMEDLLKDGADPNARLTKSLWYMQFNFERLSVDFSGSTAFWRAAYSQDVDAMKLLVKYGADPNIPTIKGPERRFRGYDAKDMADPSGLPPVPVGGPAAYPIHAATGIGFGEGYAGGFHRGVPNGWLPAVKYLVEELGADVNARDYNGYAPLHHAASRGDVDVIKYLVEHGADVTVVARRGQTTADMANGPVQRVQPFPEALHLLESLGAKNNHNCVTC